MADGPADLRTTPGDDLPAGAFSSWLADLQGALRGTCDADVPCDGCTACCSASQFVHIEPDETDTLGHIPSELLFPAPRLPRGHVLMGYDEQGRCPMLVDDACSIYEHRPRTCRAYDCRIFPAAGVRIDDDDGAKAGIAARARRWRFDFPTEHDRLEHESVRSAATFLGDHPDLLPAGPAATSATQTAVLAVESHDAFLRRDSASGGLELNDPDEHTVSVALRARRPRR